MNACDLLIQWANIYPHTHTHTHTHTRNTHKKLTWHLSEPSRVKHVHKNCTWLEAFKATNTHFSEGTQWLCWVLSGPQGRALRTVEEWGWRDIKNKWEAMRERESAADNLFCFRSSVMQTETSSSLPALFSMINWTRRHHLFTKNTPTPPSVSLQWLGKTQGEGTRRLREKGSVDIKTERKRSKWSMFTIQPQ